MMLSLEITILLKKISTIDSIVALFLLTCAPGFPLTFNISSTNTSQHCVNISVSDNGVTGSTEKIALSLSTDNSLVVVSNNSSHVKVVNDGKMTTVTPSLNSALQMLLRLSLPL